MHPAPSPKLSPRSVRPHPASADEPSPKRRNQAPSPFKPEQLPASSPLPAQQLSEPDGTGPQLKAAQPVQSAPPQQLRDGQQPQSKSIEVSIQPEAVQPVQPAPSRLQGQGQQLAQAGLVSGAQAGSGSGSGQPAAAVSTREQDAQRLMQAAQTVAAARRAQRPVQLESLLLDSSWKQALAAEMRKPYFGRLQEFLHKEWAGSQPIYPPPEMVFRALNSCPLDKVRMSGVLLPRYPQSTLGTVSPHNCRAMWGGADVWCATSTRSTSDTIVPRNCRAM